MSRTRSYQPDEMAKHMMSLPIELQDELLIRLPKLIKYHLALNPAISERFGSDKLPLPDPSLNPTTYYLYPEENSSSSSDNVRYLHIDGTKPPQQQQQQQQHNAAAAILAEQFKNLDYFSIDLLPLASHDIITKLLENNRQLCGFIFVIKHHIKKNQYGESVKTREEISLDENVAKYYKFKKLKTNSHLFYTSSQLNMSNLSYSYFMNSENYPKKNVWFSEQFFKKSVPVDEFENEDGDDDDDEKQEDQIIALPNIMEPNQCVYCLE